MKIKICQFLLILLSSSYFAQLVQITAPNMYSEVPIYKNEIGKQYSTLITFQYCKKLVNVPKGLTYFQEDSIFYPKFKNFLNELRIKYGALSIIKSIPNAVWGDTLKINKRTKKL